MFDFVFDVAATIAAHVAENLREYPLEGVVAHLAGDGLVAVVADVNSGAIEVAGVLGGVTITPTQAGYVLLGTQDAGDNDAMQGKALEIEAVLKGSANIVEQNAGTGHEIRDGGIQRIDMVVRTGTDIDKFLHALFSILTVPNGSDAPLVSDGQLLVIAVRELHMIARHTIDAVRGLPYDHRRGYDRRHFLSYGIPLGGRREGLGSRLLSGPAFFPLKRQSDQRKQCYDDDKRQ